MRKEDLRIGNNIIIDGIVRTVDARTLFDFDHDGRVKEGIELTEDLLTIMGFKPSNGYHYSKWLCEYEITSLIIDEDLLYYGISIKGEIVWSISRKIKIHQLQNLYYALTGEELTLKQTP